MNKTNLPTEIVDALNALNVIYGTPDLMNLPVILNCINTAVAPRYKVNSGVYGIRPTIMFFLTIVLSGGRKSSVSSELEGPAQEFSSKQYDLLKHDNIRFSVEDKKFVKLQKDYALGLTSTMPIPPVPLATTEYIKSTTTLNGMIDTLMGQSHIWFDSADALEFFAGHTMVNSKNGALTSATELMTALTKIWGGETISKNTGMQRTRLYNRVATMGFMIQEDGGLTVLRNNNWRAQGFTHRLLVVRVPEVKSLPIDVSVAGNAIRDAARQRIEPFLYRMRQIHSQKIKLVNDYECSQEVLEIDHDALLIMAEYSNNHIDTGSIGGVLEGKEAGFISRLNEHTVRMAANLAIFNGHSSVTLSDAVSACEIMEMFVNQRIKMELGGSDNNEQHTEVVAEFLKWWKTTKPDLTGTVKSISNVSARWFLRLGIEQRISVFKALLMDEQIYTIKENKEEDIPFLKQKFGLMTSEIYVKDFSENSAIIKEMEKSSTSIACNIAPKI